MSDKVYIVIVNFNGWRDTVECLESVFRNCYSNYAVIVCDNGSSDGSLQQIKQWANTFPIKFMEFTRTEAERGGFEEDISSNLILVDNTSNLGFAGGNNVGLRYALARADFEYVWLLNNDTVIAAEALVNMVERIKESPRVGICGSTLLYYNAPEKVQALGGGYYCKWIGLPWHLGRLKKAGDKIDRKAVESWMNYVVGASMLVTKGFLQDIGLMCEDYFLYFEETDWAIRAKGRYFLAYAPNSIVYHKIGASIGTSSNPQKKSFICDFYNIRNRLFFTRKFYPYALPSVYLFLLLALAGRVLMGKWDRVKMILQLFFHYNQYACLKRDHSRT